MIKLSRSQIAYAKVQLGLVRTIQGQTHERIEHSRSPEFKDLGQMEQLAYVTTTSSMIDLLSDEVDKLYRLMGLDPKDGNVEEKLLAMVGMFDGNRRRFRPI